MDIKREGVAKKKRIKMALYSVLLLAVLAPYLGTIDPTALATARRTRPPSIENWFGTDMLGRDVYSRTIYGARVSLTVGISVALLASGFGLAIGLVTGFSRWTDAIAQLQQVPDDSTVILSARLDLAKAESEVGQTAQAIKDLQSVSTLDQDGEVYFRLAALYRKNGDEAQAHDALATFQQRRAASLQTDNDELSGLEKEQDTGQLTALPSPH